MTHRSYPVSLTSGMVGRYFAKRHVTLNILCAGYQGLDSQYDEGIPAGDAPIGDYFVDDHEMGSPIFIPCTHDDSSGKPLQVQRLSFSTFQFSPSAQRAIESILYIADHIKKDEEDERVSSICSDKFNHIPITCDVLQQIVDDWKYMATVLDRLFLWIFTIACILGTCGIILKVTKTSEAIHLH